MNRKALWIAGALSFGVYLIPLFNVHAGLVPIGLLLGGLAEPSVYALATVVAMLAVQAAVAALLYWVVSRFRWWKALALVALAPLVALGVNWLFLVALPLAVLVEADRRPEIGTLELACTLPDATLAEPRSGVALGVARAAEAWVILHDGWRRGLMRMPGCRADAVPTGALGSSVDHVAAGGHILFVPRSGGHAYLGPGMTSPVELSPPQGVRHWSPILADDGRTVAWLDRAPAEAALAPHRVRLRALPRGPETDVVLALAPRDQLTLLGAAPERDRYTLARYRNEILEVDGSGNVVWGPVSPPGVHDARWGFARVGDGWVAWDGYREEGRSRIVWSLNEGSGDVALPRGRGIQSLAVSPAGTYVAVSIESRLNVGATRSAVVVLRTADGAEIFRRYGPKLARTRLAFLGPRHLAMTRSVGKRGFVDVHLLPPAGIPQ